MKDIQHGISLMLKKNKVFFESCHLQGQKLSLSFETFPLQSFVSDSKWQDSSALIILFITPWAFKISSAKAFMLSKNLLFQKNSPCLILKQQFTYAIAEYGTFTKIDEGNEWGHLRNVLKDLLQR